MREQPRERALDLSGTLSLSGIVGLLSLARLVISNDTGPLHLAGAVGTPTVGIYWCGNLINANPLTRTRHRALASWMITCPLCGADMANPQAAMSAAHRECTHDVCFVAGVTVHDVLASATDLLHA
jgi:ADP-heptose:LPS heptosyltransferase